MPEKALAGIKVLEYADLISGPYCSKLLSNLGAEVIKVEEPKVGDRSRSAGPFPNDIPDHEKSGLFLYLNANKLGITLNTKTETGLAIFKELVKGVDIVVENHPPQVMEDVGLNYPLLNEINHHLILTSITPFGQNGPYRDYKAYDINSQAAGGLAYVTGDAEREPLLTPWGQAGYQAALNAAVGTLSALYWREASGSGQHVDISVHECIASILGDVISFYSYMVTVRPRCNTISDLAGMTFWPVDIYECKDGYVNICVLEPHQWRSFVDLIGNPDWATDPRLEDRRLLYESTERQEAPDLGPLIKETLKKYTVDELFHGGQQRRIPITPVNDAQGALTFPQLNERGFFVEIDHPKAGRLRYPGAPFRLSETPWSLDRLAPLLGEHNEEVYSRMGYTKNDLVKMAEAGII